VTTAALIPWAEGTTVPVVDPPPAEEFRRLSRRPIVLRGLARDWPATQRWSFAALRERFGTRELPLVRTCDGLLGYDEQDGMDYEPRRLADHLDAFDTPHGADHFLTVPASEYLPELLADVDGPAYCESAGWRDWRISIGARGIVTPIHREVLDNIFTVIHGSKELVLFDPLERRVYGHSLLSGVPHLAQVDPRRLDEQQFPRARALAPLRATLHDGDAIYIPAFWWHAVRTVEPTVALGSWWAEGVWTLVPRAAAIYKQLAGIRT
jgi:Cupin-like domain